MRSAVLLVSLIVLAVLIGLGLWLYTPDKSRTSLETSYGVSQADYLEVAGIRLRVVITGPTDAPTVILLHGFGASLETWAPWAQRLAPEFRVIRFDLPGFALTGADPSGDYSDRRSLQVLAALMDRLGLAQASLVGNSLGGKLAWEFAAAHPHRVHKLVLISPDGYASPGFEYGVRPKLPVAVRALPYMLPAWLVRISLQPAYADRTRLSSATVTRYRDMMLAPGVRPAMIARMQQIMLQDPRADLARIQAPTLIMWGERDGMIPFTNAADYLHAITGATLDPLPNLGHVPFEEAPDQTIGPVIGFLRGQR